MAPPAPSNPPERLCVAEAPPSRKPHRLVLLYVLFALLSVATNLGVQQAAVLLLTGRVGAVLPLSMVCGTGAGFVSKYMLDKNFIFFDRSAAHRDEARKLALYGFFSVFTTALFWTTEAASFRLVGTAEAKYTGAVVGLTLGYALKFALDRRFTFARPRPEPSPEAVALTSPTSAPAPRTSRRAASGLPRWCRPEGVRGERSPPP